MPNTEISQLGLKDGTIVDIKDSKALRNTNIIEPSNGQALVYDSSSSKWVNRTISGGGGASSLDDLSDTDLNDPYGGQVLGYNGESWENQNMFYNVSLEYQEVEQESEGEGEIPIPLPSGDEQAEPEYELVCSNTILSIFIDGINGQSYGPDRTRFYFYRYISEEGRDAEINIPLSFLEMGRSEHEGESEGEYIENIDIYLGGKILDPVTDELLEAIIYGQGSYSIEAPQNEGDDPVITTISESWQVDSSWPAGGGGSTVSGTDDGTNWTSITINGTTKNIPSGGGEGGTSLTYAELVSKIDNGRLIPGQQYRITDYETRTIQQNTHAAGHNFDIVVTAVSENQLQAEASMVARPNDHFFDFTDLSKWRIWYTVRNDHDRYEWADNTQHITNLDSYSSNGAPLNRMPDYDNHNPNQNYNSSHMYAWGVDTDIALTDADTYGHLVYSTSDRLSGGDEVYNAAAGELQTAEVSEDGKGVIYRMIDSCGNDCHYDMVNIGFDACYMIPSVYMSVQGMTSGKTIFKFSEFIKTTYNGSDVQAFKFIDIANSSNIVYLDYFSSNTFYSDPQLTQELDSVDPMFLRIGVYESDVGTDSGLSPDTYSLLNLVEYANTNGISLEQVNGDGCFYTFSIIPNSEGMHTTNIYELCSMAYPYGEHITDEIMSIVFTKNTVLPVYRLDAESGTCSIGQNVFAYMTGHVGATLNFRGNTVRGKSNIFILGARDNNIIGDGNYSILCLNGLELKNSNYCFVYSNTASRADSSESIICGGSFDITGCTHIITNVRCAMRGFSARRSGGLFINPDSDCTEIRIPSKLATYTSSSSPQYTEVAIPAALNVDGNSLLITRDSNNDIQITKE